MFSDKDESRFLNGMGLPVGGNKQPGIKDAGWICCVEHPGVGIEKVRLPGRWRRPALVRLRHRAGFVHPPPILGQSDSRLHAAPPCLTTGGPGAYAALSFALGGSGQGEGRISLPTAPDRSQKKATPPGTTRWGRVHSNWRCHFGPRPLSPCKSRIAAFKTAALDHSAIPPALPIYCDPAGNGPAGYPIFEKTHLTRRRVFCQSLSCRVEGARG